MEEIGKVIKEENGIAVVEITRKSACGENCASCGAHCADRAHTAEAINEIGAVCGDTVRVILPGKKLLSAAFLVYILPLFAFLLGYLVSEAASADELYKIISGFLAMCICFAILKIYDGKMKKKYMPRIISLANSRKE